MFASLLHHLQGYILANTNVFITWVVFVHIGYRSLEIPSRDTNDAIYGDTLSKD